MSSPPVPATTPSNGLDVSSWARDRSRGSVSLRGVGRVALLPPEIIRGLHVAILEAHPETAPDILYRSGFEWALQSMVPFAARRAPQQSLPMAMENWWATFREAGWGDLRQIQEVDSNTALAELHYGAIGPALGKSDDPVCHVYAGLFAGAFSFLRQAEIHGVEFQCRATGADSCRFIVGPGATIDRVETWRQEGVAPRDIVDRIGTTFEPAAPSHGSAAPIVRDAHGIRVVAALPETFRSFHVVLDAERRGNWGAVLQATGRAAGRHLAAQRQPAAAKAVPPGLGLESLESLFADYGWGALAVSVPEDQHTPLVVASLRDGVFGDDESSARNALPAGLLLGWCESMTARPLGCVDVGMAADGETVFVVSTPEQLEPVTPLIGRRSPDEIIARLRS